MEKIEGLHKQTGKWILLSAWHCTEHEFDGPGWLEDLDPNKDVIMLPNNVSIFSRDFSAFRQVV